MTRILMRSGLVTLALLAGLALQGCVAAAAGAGAAGGYAAAKHGYEVQSPVKKNHSSNYRGQAPQQ